MNQSRIVELALRRVKSSYDGWVPQLADLLENVADEIAKINRELEKSA